MRKVATKLEAPTSHKPIQSLVLAPPEVTVPLAVIGWPWVKVSGRAVSV
jgi:hypothetical protein